MIRQRVSLSLRAAAQLRCCSTQLTEGSLGLFETDRNETDPKEIRRKRRDLSLSGTLDAELNRVSVHLGRRGEKYIPSHNLDHTAEQFCPESSNEGMPRIQQKMNQQQAERLSELIHLSEQQDDAPSIFHWEVNYVLTKGDYEHPKNKCVKMRVFMKELQRNYCLSDAAVQHIIRIVEHRYDPETGLLILASQKYPQREDNRREIMRIVSELVKEGRTKFPVATSRGSYIQRRYPKKSNEAETLERHHVQAEIKECFKMIDVDGDGRISTNDWKKFFECGHTQIDTAALENLMLYAGKSSTAELDLDAFVRALSAACVPDSRSTKRSEYKLSNRMMIFPFSGSEESDPILSN